MPGSPVGGEGKGSRAQGLTKAAEGERGRGKEGWKKEPKIPIPKPYTLILQPKTLNSDKRLEVPGFATFRTATRRASSARSWRRVSGLRVPDVACLGVLGVEGSGF